MSDAEHPFEIAVCSTAGWVAKGIQDVTGGKYNHTYLITPNYTWSMEPGGLVKRPHDYWGSDNPTSRLGLAGRAPYQFLDFIGAHRKVRYDFVGDGIVGLDDLTPAWMDPFWHFIEHWEDKLVPAWFCSAFADAAAEAAGVQLFDDGRPYHAVTPMDIYRLFVAKGWAA